MQFEIDKLKELIKKLKANNEEAEEEFDHKIRNER